MLVRSSLALFLSHALRGVVRLGFRRAVLFAVVLTTSACERQETTPSPPSLPPKLSVPPNVRLANIWKAERLGIVGARRAVIRTERLIRRCHRLAGRVGMDRRRGQPHRGSRRRTGRSCRPLRLSHRGRLAEWFRHRPHPVPAACGDRLHPTSLRRPATRRMPEPLSPNRSLQPTTSTR